MYLDGTDRLVLNSSTPQFILPFWPGGSIPELAGVPVYHGVGFRGVFLCKKKTSLEDHPAGCNFFFPGWYPAW